MAVTHGHGNPDWTRDEVVLALDLYLDCGDKLPGPSDRRVKELSAVLRAFPQHSVASRRSSFRNPAGVAFKLQNLRQVATGRGLANVSRTDREVWKELGRDPRRTKELASLIRAGIAMTEQIPEDSGYEEMFAEGRVVTYTHARRERDPKLRQGLLAKRRKTGGLVCEICGYVAAGHTGGLGESAFEAHHLIPLSAGSERRTRLSDMALLCANCHRMVHRAVSDSGRWLSIAEAKVAILGNPGT